MNPLNTLWTAAASVAALFVLTKLMGNRQMSQLSLFDYIMGISIGSIAAEMATNLDGDPLLPLMSMVVYALIDVGINVLNNKSRKARAVFLGTPLVLFNNGTLYDQNLRKAKLDLTEFLTQCRSSGYFDLGQLQLVIMEVSGRLSFLPAESARPLTPADMSLAPPQSRPVVPVIMDSVVLPERLKATGNDENWLKKQLLAQGFQDPDDVLLATVDTGNNLAVYERADPPKEGDLYT
ncbi:MAG: DUF421 domain-containing protein [Eubacteriales bacterium]|nr:DUF421 domain-containing protein [Eubacteriales bacterium]